MAIPKVDYVEKPFYQPRYTPDTTRLQAIYARGGSELTDLAGQRALTQERTLQRLAQIVAGGFVAHREGRQRNEAIAIRKAEQEADRLERQAERDARAAERKAAEAERTTERAHTAATRAVERAAPGPQSAALFAMAKRFPDLAAQFRVQAPLDARAVAGTPALEPSGGEYPVLEASHEQALAAGDRQFRKEQAAVAEAARVRDDARADASERRQDRYQTESLKIQRQTAANAAARADDDQKFVIRDGKVIPIKKGEAQPGDVPYSADAMQGMGGEASDVRSQRAASALNAIDKLQSLAPKRLPGAPGMVQGAADIVKGYAGYQTNARQYQALLGPTAMLLAVAVQGAAGLSNSEREAMKAMLGNIATMDYETQMALLQNARDMISGGADVARAKVKDAATGQLVEKWLPKRSRMPGAVQVTAPGEVPSGKPTILSITPVTPAKK